MITLSLKPAPPRGQYDRAQPREERLHEQRERLLAATALAFADGEGATVGSVVKLARVARNTFYEYFDDIEHARRELQVRALHKLDQALQEAESRTRTPIERWRALAQGWVGWASNGPLEAQLVLRVSIGRLTSAGARLEQALVRSLAALRAVGIGSAGHETVRVTAVAAAAEALGRGLIRDGNGVRIVPAQHERDAAERALADVAVRLLR